MEGIAKFARAIDAMNEIIGKITAWSALGLVLVQFGIVMINYLYSEGSIAVQESLTYMHSLLFLGAAGYTLLHNGHVRVDIIYSKLNEKKKAWINLLGSLIILFPVLIFIGVYAWPFVSQSWGIMEGSIETSGLHIVYILKSMILLFVASTFLQGVSISLHSLLIITGREHLVEEQLTEGV
ncbi:TRAP transporter small permease subunit [Pseudemcibacter aquimaris]|uniref:TRAP transporter small permease subunit n=1 Tax=Pseudemcibacter aquimaris TaxID=2857064 RepID=UPI002012901B|nr:TRAP transporter small permease subunit [Pseudemcibacter aquimaris]MCC3860583.1 TRAP transporter small permease subunit [Pseudemcibacter aquimaris]WDU59405.1 TRAP transporter small permease subunit [Pseudemcibacter aquimaris]